MNIKSTFKPFLLFLSIFVLALGACSKENTSNTRSGNDLFDTMPTPIYYENENDYIFYSDDYFKSPSTTYNEHLATLSVQMAKYSMNPGGPKNKDDTAWYEGQSNRLKTFYDLIGFEKFEVNDDYKARTGFDTIGIAAASRKMGDFTIIACTVRSGGYFLEWENNVFLGDGSNSNMMHEGWYNAALKVDNFLKDYIGKNKIVSKVKLWLAGYSRGGAVINLTGGMLDNRFDKGGSYEIYDHVNIGKDWMYIYTFEAPQGANVNSTGIKTPKDSLYNNIFNVVNPNDIVTKVGMNDWGFQRFGIDKFITTEFFDVDNFEANRNTAKKFYALEKPNESWKCDNITPYNIDESSLAISAINIGGLVKKIIDTVNEVEGGEMPSFIYKDDTKANYDTNIVSTIFLEQSMERMSRKYYNSTIQNCFRKIMKKLFDDLNSSDILADSDTAVKLLIQFVVFEFTRNTDWVIDLTEIFGLTDDEETYLYDLIDGIFYEYPGELITLGLNAAVFNQNHDTDVNVAHLKAQDSFYIDLYKQQKGEALKKVPLRSNAEFFCVNNVDINDIIVINDSQNAKKVMSLKGSSTDRSTIEYCNKGYALGYYHYATYERSKAFMPACYDYYIGMYSHSNDIWHQVTSRVWRYTSNNKDIAYRRAKTVVDEYFNGDSGVIQTHAYKTVEPE